MEEPRGEKWDFARYMWDSEGSAGQLVEGQLAEELKSAAPLLADIAVACVSLTSL